MDGDGSAHGRVNLIGEHTDYNGGFVLPTLIPQRTVVAVRTRTDKMIAIGTDADGGASVQVSLDSLEPRHDWSDYVAGVAFVLVRNGHELRGFDAIVRSSVPIGAGLASSAALCVATARALRDAFGLAANERALATYAHDAENTFVGAHVGVMDQMVCALGHEGEALFIDTSNGSTRSIPIDDFDIAVIDSGIRHDNANGLYNVRRRECEAAAHAFDVHSLRDLGPDPDLFRLAPTQLRRARHVISENARVLAAVEAIERGDAAAVGRLVRGSHASLRDDFEVSTPEIDRIVESAQRDRDVYGARITGGGFGGSVLLLTKPGTAREAADRTVAASSGRVVVPA